MLIKKRNKNTNLAKGQSLVELMIVIGLCAVMLPALITGLVSSRSGKAQQKERVCATNILKETEESVRSIREGENGWDELELYTGKPSVYTNLVGTVWAFTEGIGVREDPECGEITTEIAINNIYRDADNAITTEGATGAKLDPSTKKVHITIGWNKPIAGSFVDSTLYLTRYVGNAIDTETSETDFDEGEKANVEITNNEGGEVELALAEQPKAKWCEPSFSDESVNLPEVPTAVAAVPGHVFVSMGKAGATAASFAHVLVNTDPLSFTLAGKLTGGYKTLAVSGDGSYAYLALDTTGSKKVVIIDLNQYADPVNKIYKEVGSFSVSNNNFPATSISVFNNRGYVTLGGYLYAFDLTSKTGARTRIGQPILFSYNVSITHSNYSPAKETNIRLVGSKTYAYVGVNGLYQSELVIIDVTKYDSTDHHNTQWKVVGEVDIDPNFCSHAQLTRGVYVNPEGTRAYLSDANANDYKEFFVIDIHDPAHPVVLGGSLPHSCTGSYGGWEAGGMDPQQSVVTLPLVNRALVVGTSGPEQYVVLDVSPAKEASPTRCGGLAWAKGIFGVASAEQDNGDVYAFLITGDSTQDLKVVQGGPDIEVGKYMPTGTFISQAFDSTVFASKEAVVFNRFVIDADTPSDSKITFQIAAADAVGGSCNHNNYTFIGPNLTDAATDVFDSGSTIPWGNYGTYFKNPSRCFKYKAFLSSSTSGKDTPVLNAFSFNYSP